MQQDKLNFAESVLAKAVKNSLSNDQLHAEGRYIVTCRDAEGNLKWEDHFDNLVVTGGLNNCLDSYFAGSAYTAAWYMGLVDGATTPTIAAADTMASHAGWTENQAYTASTRPAVSWSAASGGTKSLSSAIAFTANAAATIAGCFLTTNSAKGGTTGTLFSAGAFTGGNKVLASGDTVNVSYSITI